MIEDVSVGEELALSFQDKKPTAYELAQAIEHHLDYNRFDHETGETDLLAATLTVVYGYLQAGGQLDFAEEVERDRQGWAEDEKDMAKIKREWDAYRLEGDETPGWKF